MYSLPSFEESIFTIRFSGEDFNEHGVTIYDFANTLISVQRIFHKAFLSMDGRLEFGRFPKRNERENLALMIGKRKFASDAFALVPMLSDPNIQAFLIKIADYVASGMIGYYVGDVLDRIKKEPDINKQIFIGSIHAEVVNIVGRIDATGGVASIQFGAPLSGMPVFCDFTPQTKDYLKSIAGEFYYGAFQVIKGNVYRLYINSNMVTIRRPGGTKVDIRLKEHDYHAIHAQEKKNLLVSFVGRPIFKFGVESRSITDFEAESIEIHL